MTSYNKEETFIPYYRLQSNCSQTIVKCVDGALNIGIKYLNHKSTQNSYEFIHKILSSGFVFNPVKVKL